MTVTSVVGKRLADQESPVDAVSPHRKKACSRASPVRQEQAQQKKRLRLPVKPPALVLPSKDAMQPAAADPQPKKAKLQHDRHVSKPEESPKASVCLQTGEGLERAELDSAVAAIGEALAATSVGSCADQELREEDAGLLPSSPPFSGGGAAQAVDDNAMADSSVEDWQQLFDGLQLGGPQHNGAAVANADARSGPSTPAKTNEGHATCYDGRKRTGFLHKEFARVQQYHLS